MKKLTAAAAFTFLLGSCSAPYNSVQLFQVCAFPTPSGGACTYSATCTNSLAGEAYLDVTGALANGSPAFRLALQINNLTPSSTNTANGTVNVNDAYVQTIEVSYPGTSLAAISLPVAITVPAAGSTTYETPLIPASYFASLAGAVSSGANVVLVLNVKATGVFTWQQSFTTQTFQIPVVLCSGCANPSAECGSNQTLQGVCPGGGEYQTNSPLCQ